MKNKLFSQARILSFIASDTFFKVVLGLLVVQALWIAFSGRYPLAFDEDFHAGIINLYTHHISPFWSAHPAGGDAFGAVARDPSYLYHWLMSFPVRFVNLITDNGATQITWIRMLNIGLFAYGLWLYRQLLFKVKASRVLVHLALLIFVLVPIVPYLSAHINYDNLLFPLTAGVLLLALRVQHSMKAGSLDIKAVLALIPLIMIACLVKYAFLPIALAVVVFLLISTYKLYGNVPAAWKAISLSSRNLSKPVIVITALVFLIIGGLFVERYGVNVVRYQTPAPECDKVLSYENCQHYGPWIRDYNLEKNKGEFTPNPLAFTASWVEGMWFRSFFAISGPTIDYQNSGPLLMPALGSIVFSLLGLGAFILTAKKLWRRYYKPALWLLAGVAATYAAVLWIDVFMLYVQAGKPVAINGRYLIPILPIIILFGAMAVNTLLGNRQKLKLWLGAVLVLCMIWGGGALTYVLRSNDAWYWDGSSLKSLNKSVKDALGPITPGYDDQHLFRP